MVLCHMRMEVVYKHVLLILINGNLVLKIVDFK